MNGLNIKRKKKYIAELSIESPTTKSYCGTSGLFFIAGHISKLSQLVYSEASSSNPDTNQGHVG